MTVGIERLPQGEAEVIAASSETRDAGSVEARQRVRELMGAARATGAALLLKKVDSRMRGHAGAELAGALDASEAPFAVLTPALPRLGRVVSNGVLELPGEPPLRLAELLAEGGLSTALVGPSEDADELELELAEAGAAADVVICDGASDRHLASVADAALRLAPRPLLAGSSGLTEQLALLLFGGAAATPAFPGPVERVLFLLGSLHPSLVRQLARLVAERPVARLPLAEARALAERGARAPRSSVAIESITAGAGVSVPDGGATAADLAAVATKLLAVDRFGAVVCSGGAVAAALCRSLGETTLQLLCELGPGFPLVRTGSTPLLALRSGGFGDDADLVNAYDALTKGGDPACAW